MEIYVSLQIYLTLLGSPSGNFASRSALDSLRGSLVLATYTGTVRLDNVSIMTPPFSILQKYDYIYIYLSIHVLEKSSIMTMFNSFCNRIGETIYTLNQNSPNAGWYTNPRLAYYKRTILTT